MRKLDESTLMPLSFVGGFLAIGIWVGVVQSENRANAEKWVEVKTEVQAVQQINERLSKIEGKVELIYDTVRDQREFRHPPKR